MRGLGSIINETLTTPSGRMVCTLEALLTCGIWILFINETPMAPSVRMVCIVEALFLCGFWGLLSINLELSYQ